MFGQLTSHLAMELQSNTSEPGHIAAFVHQLTAALCEQVQGKYPSPFTPSCLMPLLTHQHFSSRGFHEAHVGMQLARQRARELANTPEFSRAQRQRKKVEALFVELKNQIGLRRLRLRRMKFVREQFFLAAAAQNIKRLVRFLIEPPAPLPVSN